MFSKTYFMHHTKQDQKNTVRSEFIVQNIFSYMIQYQYRFNTICAKNQMEKDTLEILKGILIELNNEYGSDLRNQCLDIHPINEDTIESILTDISNELFAEGITWIRIVTFFAFVGELTRNVIARKLSESLVNIIFMHFSIFVREKLEVWIQEHDGWENINIEKKVKPQLSWFKFLLYTTLIIMGTISKVQNVLNGSEIFKSKTV